MSTDNAMRAKITDDVGIKYIQSEMVPKLKDNKYGEAFLKYTAAIETSLDYYAKEGKPYDPSAGFSFIAAIIALVLGGLGGYGVREVLISSMSNVTPAARASEYLVDGSSTYLMLMDPLGHWLLQFVQLGAKPKILI